MSRGLRRYAVAITVTLLLGGCVFEFPTEPRASNSFLIRNEASRPVLFTYSPPESVELVGSTDDGTRLMGPGESRADIAYRDSWVDGLSPDCFSWVSVEATVDGIVVGTWGPGTCEVDEMVVTNQDLLAAGVDIFAGVGVLDAVSAGEGLSRQDWALTRTPQDPDVARVVRLERDFVEGVIGVDQFARYGVYRWFEPEQVPDAYRLPVAEWGPWQELEAAIAVTMRVWPDLEPETQEELAAFLRTISQYPSDMLPEGWTVRGPETP